MAVVEENYKLLSFSQESELIKLIIEYIPGYLEQQKDNIMISRLKIDKELLQMLLPKFVQGYCHYLKYIDLSEVSFDNIDISGKSLEGTNANVDPQTIGHKSLFYTNIKGLNMEGKNFKGTYIQGANLEDTNAFINVNTIYGKIDGARLKGCVVTNVDDSEKDKEEFSGATIIDSYYDTSKQYIKSLFNKD